MSQDTGKFRTNTLDQFYTNEIIAKQCIDKIIQTLPSVSEYLWIEPSAGSGSFLDNVPSDFEKIGMDIDPKSDIINAQDYLKWSLPQEFENKNIVVFGNPPFGRQSTLAKSFIAKSCAFAKVIAFILPKSFTKPSMSRAFDSKFHCLASMELDNNAFVLNGAPYDVPCVFQIWQRRDNDRPRDERIEPIGFRYVKQSEGYHLAIRRVGANAGKPYLKKDTSFSNQSHYFIRLDDNFAERINELRETLNQHVFPSNTVGPRSLSKSEINIVVNSQWQVNNTDLPGKTR
jgi:hypothetical protein